MDYFYCIDDYEVDKINFFVFVNYCANKYGFLNQYFKVDNYYIDFDNLFSYNIEKYIKIYRYVKFLYKIYIKENILSVYLYKEC